MKLHMVVPVEDSRSTVVPGPQVVPQSSLPVHTRAQVYTYTTQVTIVSVADSLLNLDEHRALLHSSILGARKISPLPCSLQIISQNGGF